MSTTAQEPKVQTNDDAILGFVDCDVHPYTKTPADLDAFLPERWRNLRQSIGNRSRAPFVFGHDCQFTTGPGQPFLISSYHPSQQNTSTGKLNEKMLLDVFRRARRLASQVVRTLTVSPGKIGKNVITPLPPGRNPSWVVVLSPQPQSASIPVTQRGANCQL